MICEDEMEKPLTKKARMEAARAIIDRNQMDVEFPPEDVAALADVCGFPYEGCVLRKNVEFPNASRHLHIKVNGEWSPWSWSKDIQGRDTITETKVVMRREIQPHMATYREHSGHTSCQICGEENDLTVDHLEPPFIEIIKNYVAAYGWPEIVSRPSQIGRMIKDRDVAFLWYGFHAANANYQILCRSCNSSKGSKAS
jgi:5-methylcytosine-specific restriction endonuclease McrA